jgi:hypothetical protein
MPGWGDGTKPSWIIHEGVEMFFVAKRLYRAGGLLAGYKPFATPAPPECG